MLDEHFKRNAEVGKAVICRVSDAVFCAAAPADLEPGASQAQFGKCCLHLPELALRRAVKHLDQVPLHQVAQLPARLDEKVAGVDVSVMLDNDIAAALFHAAAFRRFQTDVRMEDAVEESNGDGRPAVPKIAEPAVENLAQEFSEGFAGNREWSGGAGSVVGLDDGDELKEFLLAFAGKCLPGQESVSLSRKLSRIIVHNREDIVGD